MVFLVLVLLGLVLRLNQGAAIAIPPDRFYSVMTLHGLGMAGTLFIGGLAAIWYRSLRYVQPSLALFRWVYGLVLAGTVGLIAATLLGRYGPGWYMLYPAAPSRLWLIPFFARACTTLIERWADKYQLSGCRAAVLAFLRDSPASASTSCGGTRWRWR